MMLEQLFYTPVMSIADSQKSLEEGYPSALGITNQFEELGIIKEVTGKKRDKRFVYAEYLTILSQGT